MAGGRYGFGIINFANPDMVGHTGVIPAAVNAVEAVDACLGEVVATVHAIGRRLLITADHGNGEHMLEPDGCPTPRTRRTRSRSIVTVHGRRAARAAASSPTSRRPPSICSASTAADDRPGDDGPLLALIRDQP